MFLESKWKALKKVGGEGVMVVGGGGGGGRGWCDGCRGGGEGGVMVVGGGERVV